MKNPKIQGFPGFPDGIQTLVSQTMLMIRSEKSLRGAELCMSKMCERGGGW